MKRRILPLFLTAAIIAAALCGCGGGKQQTSGGGTSSSGEIVYGGDITVGIAQDLGDSLDPYQMTAAGTKEVLFNVYEGLVKPDSEGNLDPAVAENWAVSDDGLVYTFTLREGVKFHNGESVTADDVVYSINKCADTTTDSSVASALSAVKSVEATDEKTVVVTLAEPNTDFLSYMTLAIVPADYADEATSPVGTGPFKFVSRSVQENVVLEKFDDYWGTPAYLDSVTYKIYEDGEALVMALQSGAVDIAAHLSVTQSESLGSDYNILEGTMNLVQAMYLNNKVKPFDDVRVRQALCYAVDVDGILQLTEDGRGTKVGSSMYPNFKKYFVEELGDTYSYDPEKARQLLADAGYPDGFSFAITVPSNYTPHVDTAQVITEQLRQVGINATIKEVEWNTWLSDVYQNRNFEATVIGFDASSLTARAMLERWTTGNSKNMINYSNADYDKAFAAAIASTDDAEQTELYKQCETILAEDAANVYIQDLADMVAVRNTLDGYVFYPLYVMDMSTIHYVG